jgi:hypothetical protein
MRTPLSHCVFEALGAAVRQQPKLQGTQNRQAAKKLKADDTILGVLAVHLLL